MFVMSAKVENVRSSGFGAHVARFRKAQDGTFTVFGLFILVMMLVASGMAIDIVRHEQKRLRIQSTLDRAVLAAADLGQQIPAETVVQDYIDKANLGDITVTIPPATSANDIRDVKVKVNEDMDSLFLNMVGIPTMAINASSRAVEQVSNVEISMVLDISGTMRFASSAGGSRISHLRDAGEAFVDLVLTGPAANTTTVNLVPYAGQVNPGPYLFDAIGGVRTHAYSSCVQLEDADFQHTGLPFSSTMQVAHFNQWGIGSTTGPDWMQWGWCPSPASSVIVASNDATQLKTQIRNMPLHDGTGTHAGMKWGLALLDPSSNALFRDMDGQGMNYTADRFEDPNTQGGQPVTVTTNANFVADPFEDRPALWSDTNSKKYIVLMTDGAITDQFTPKYTGFNDLDAENTDNEQDYDNVDGIYYDYANATVAANNQRANMRSIQLTAKSENVANLKRVCDLAKAQNITIFTIGYEIGIGSTAEGEMKYCASTDSHYHRVEGLDITKTFESIAREIYDLRLVN